MIFVVLPNHKLFQIFAKDVDFKYVVEADVVELLHSRGEDLLNEEWMKLEQQ